METRLHLRLRQSDRKLLEEHLELVQSPKTTILCAGFEDYDIKTAKPSAAHVHVYLTSTEHDDTIRKRVKALGYSTGVNYYLKKYDRSDDNYRYMCKGKARGDYDVAYLEETRAAVFNAEFWDKHDEIERRKDTGARPIYLQIVDHIQRNREQFEKHVYRIGETEVLVQDYIADRDGQFDELRTYLDEEKAVRYILKRYSENGPLFDHENVKKVMWLLVTRIDEDRAVSKALRLIGSFKAEW